MHRVNIVYKPDKEGEPGEEIVFPFTDEAIARQFAKDQATRPNIISAKYLGTEAHSDTVKVKP